MKFALKQTQNELRCVKNGATNEEIQLNNDFGYTHFLINGDSYFINVHDEYDRAKLLKTVGLENYEFFEETTGLKHWVLYNPVMYKVDKDWDNQKILKLRTNGYNGIPLETPINASSLVGLFLWTTIPKNLKFGPRFDMSNIVDVSLMFAGSKIPRNFNFDPIFTNTKSLLLTRYMFYKTVLPDGFTIPDTFNSSKVVSMEYMFSRCVLPKNIYLNIDNTSLLDANHMFYDTTVLADKISLGSKFIYRPDINMSFMFDKDKHE